MRCVTFQSMGALQTLVSKGYLVCDETKIALDTYGHTYAWVVKKMNERMENPTHAPYPIWCWVRCYHHICPSRRKGTPVDGFDVKITFDKPKADVFITDFRRYSFVLNNCYIPTDRRDKEKFDRLLARYNITADELRAYVRKDICAAHRTDQAYLQVCEEIVASFDRCITEDSDVLQGCVWEIRLDEVDRIEILHDKSCRYGSLNGIRKNGTRINWQEDFYRLLKAGDSNG